MRLSENELEDIKKKYGVDELFSWSRINTYMTSPYEYYLKYVKKIKEDKPDSAYAPLGGIAHEILERFYGNEIKYEEMIDEFEDGWITAYEIGQLAFNRSSEENNKSIAEKYHANIKHFFKNHKPITDKVYLEQFICTKIGDTIFQGYADIIIVDKDNNYIIGDWKTSSIYKGKTAEEKAGQLVIYALGLHQTGIPMEKIKICWDFLKYVNVICEKPSYVKVEWETVKGEKKEKEKLDKTKLVSTLKTSIKAWMKKLNIPKEDIDFMISELELSNDFTEIPNEVMKHFHIEDLEIDNPPRQIERCKIGETLKADCKKQMKKLGYSEEEITEAVDTLIMTNSILSLPADVQEKYIVSDCFVYVPLTDKLVNKWIEDIENTLYLIKTATKEYKETENERLFWESQERVESESFYFANLCGYSAHLHKPYAEYLSNLEKEKDEKENLYGGLGENIEKDTSNKSINESNENNNKEDDLSWLDEL